MRHDEGISNQSENRPFQNVLKASLSRRSLLTRSVMLSAAGFVTALGASKLEQAMAAPSIRKGSATTFEADSVVAQQRSGLVSFKPVSGQKAAGATMPLISEDYEYQVLIPWGTSLKNGVRSWVGDPDNRPTAEEQQYMVGIGHDGMTFFPIDDSSSHGVLCINHEFGTNFHVLGYDAPTSMEDVRRSQHAHGCSVVEIKEEAFREGWSVVDSKLNRRIHVNTPVKFGGPVAGHPLLETPAGNQPKGTVNNCANGQTPWGTYLTCEENFNGYFGSTKGEAFDDQRTPEQKRYGLDFEGFGYGWYNFDERFDLSNPQFKNEENRFGWVVEIDPMDPNKPPVKRTALGRFKHESCAITVARDNRVVGYMGDDERFDYIYKFVSDGDYENMLKRGLSPLDSGKLYVAKFLDNNEGMWLLLDKDENPSLKNNDDFPDQAHILTYARLAADALGATPMDRPEWATVAAGNEYVYFSLTNNSRREEADGPNPLAPNPDGHILRMKEQNEDPLANTFTWEVFVIAEDTHPANVDACAASDDGNFATDATFSDPDGLYIDADNRLFIETDGGQKCGLNNQMLVCDTNTGEIRRLFTGLPDDEITGLTITPNRRTLFCNSQHPGDGDPTVTNFPAKPGSGQIPRDCTFVIIRKNGGIVGS